MKFRRSHFWRVPCGARRIPLLHQFSLATRAAGKLLRQRKRARREFPAAPRLRVKLENELAAQFEYARIKRARDLAKQGVSEAVVERVVLSVVEGVERLEAKFEVCPLCHRERLIERPSK